MEPIELDWSWGNIRGPNGFDIISVLVRDPSGIPYPYNFMVILGFYVGSSAFCLGVNIPKFIKRIHFDIGRLHQNLIIIHTKLRGLG